MSKSRCNASAFEFIELQVYLVLKQASKKADAMHRLIIFVSDDIVFLIRNVELFLRNTLDRVINPFLA